MIADYDELKATIADFLNREDLTAVIPTFIRLAEARISRDLRHWRQEKRSTAQLNAQYSEIPADFVQPIRFQLTDLPTNELKPLSLAQMLQMRGDRNDRTGRPEYYALTAGSIELFPTPDAEYNASLVYYGTVPALSASNTTNWLLTQAPDAYLYGSLVHSAPYLKEDSRIAAWAQFYQGAVDALSTEDDRAQTASAGLKARARMF